MSYTWCPAFPDELKKLEEQVQRLRLQLICLENNIKNADYSDFDYYMAEYNRVQAELMKTAKQRDDAKRAYCLDNMCQ